MKHLRTTLLFLLLCGSATAQDLNGYWYGSGNVANGGSSNNYMFELLLEQKGTTVKAIVNYYFKNAFRSFKLNGNYNSLSRTVTLFNLPVTYYNSPVNLEVDCPMDFVGQVRISRVGANIKGSFAAKGSYRNTCPPLYFDLKQNKDAGNRDSVLQAIAQFKEQRQYWTPGADDTLVAVNVQQRPVVNYVVSNEFTKRSSELVETIEVDADSVSVDFYDNGEIDGDSISVFYNQQLLTFNRLLSTRAIHFTVGLDPTRDYNEVSMFANNLGRYPPNTALMTVWDGRQRHEVRLSSNLEKNAMVRIRRKKPKPNP
ncbi:hypothetical protein [Flaviaesturariibacter aridisoli]|uniref:Uncharacterized protein n=1 Tax=Flaviaesturariibacter aridisoli TaxID=2545761 RepID=A0A4R4E3Y7_9BACT|nr:hypothetical protein [Flaviaesturariibacter aridisoli]TCZ74149.1 hypothetical protein E0486_03475 [Flaviaesturariibacter aridisoli]